MSLSGEMEWRAMKIDGMPKGWLTDRMGDRISDDTACPPCFTVPHCSPLLPMAYNCCSLHITLHHGSSLSFILDPYVRHSTKPRILIFVHRIPLYKPDQCENLLGLQDGSGGPEFIWYNIPVTPPPGMASISISAVSNRAGSLTPFFVVLAGQEWMTLRAFFPLVRSNRSSIQSLTLWKMGTFFQKSFALQLEISSPKDTLADGVFEMWTCRVSLGLACCMLGEGAVGMSSGMWSVARSLSSQRLTCAWWTRTFSFHCNQRVIWAYSSLRFVAWYASFAKSMCQRSVFSVL